MVGFHPIAVSEDASDHVFDDIAAIGDLDDFGVGKAGILEDGDGDEFVGLTDEDIAELFVALDRTFDLLGGGPGEDFLLEGEAFFFAFGGRFIGFSGIIDGQFGGDLVVLGGRRDRGIRGLESGVGGRIRLVGSDSSGRRSGGGSEFGDQFGREERAKVVVGKSGVESLAESELGGESAEALGGVRILKESRDEERVAGLAFLVASDDIEGFEVLEEGSKPGDGRIGGLLVEKGGMEEGRIVVEGDGDHVEEGAVCLAVLKEGVDGGAGLFLEGGVGDLGDLRVGIRGEGRKDDLHLVGTERHTTGSGHLFHGGRAEDKTLGHRGKRVKEFLHKSCSIFVVENREADGGRFGRLSGEDGDGKFLFVARAGDLGAFFVEEEVVLAFKQGDRFAGLPDLSEIFEIDRRPRFGIDEQRAFLEGAFVGGDLAGSDGDFEGVGEEKGGVGAAEGVGTGFEGEESIVGGTEFLVVEIELARRRDPDDGSGDAEVGGCARSGDGAASRRRAIGGAAGGGFGAAGGFGSGVGSSGRRTAARLEFFG